jgi:hypothetical protein
LEINQDLITQDPGDHLQSQNGPSSINPDEVFLELPSAYANADAILKVLARCSTRDEIEAAFSNPNSKLRDRMQRSRAQFQMHQQTLGSQDYYIVPSWVTEALFRDHEAAWQIAHERDISLHDVIHKINLAALLYTLCEWWDSHPDDETVRNSVRFNDNMFPISFMTLLVDSSEENRSELLTTGISRTKEASLGMAASLRTQVAIMDIKDSLNQSQGSDPSIILREVFHNTADMETSVKTVEMLEQQPLREWQFGGPLLPRDATRIQEFIALIDQKLPDQASQLAFENGDENNSHWLDELLNAYSWQGFVIDCAVWVQERTKELTTQIQLRGGVEEIANLVERLRTEDPSLVQPSLRMLEISPSTFTTPQRDHPTPFDVQVTTPSQHQVFYQQLRSYAAKTMNTIQEAEHRIPSLLDSQPNGQKVTFEDSLPPPAQSTSKRKRRQDDDEVSQDGGFKKKRGNSIVGTQASPIQSSDLETNSGSGGPVASQGIQSVELLTTFGNTTATDQLRFEAISQGYEAVKRAGKDIAEHRKNEAKAEDDRKVQERKRWTKEETTALIAYIEEIGTSWAMIQKTDQARGAILQGRDQVALKDKARNLKFEYMKANAAVPKNFDGVSLSKAMRDKLAAWSGAVAQPQSQTT